MFLTRDTKLAARRDVEAAVYLLSSNDPADQMREVARHFGIRWGLHGIHVGIYNIYNVYKYIYNHVHVGFVCQVPHVR